MVADVGAWWLLHRPAGHAELYGKQYHHGLEKHDTILERIIWTTDARGRVESHPLFRTRNTSSHGISAFRIKIGYARKTPTTARFDAPANGRMQNVIVRVFTTNVVLLPQLL